MYTLSAFSWGATGHRVTGWIAEQYLNKNAKKRLEQILKGQSLAIASTWMDEIRSDSLYDHTADWHWVTIQDGQTYAQSIKNKNGDVVQTIERIIADLKSKKLNMKEEQEAVKMLIHLIGDIHQPLHVGGGNDRGGNDIKVTWFREDSNLHRIWDSDMIDDTKLSYTEFAQSLERPDATRLAVIQKSNINDWVAESMSYRQQVYKTGNGKLGYQYAYRNMNIVRDRLLLAGIRIATVLNELYGK
ncbi:S1/P1 Nuclease [Pseudochryseolinea flava]|uniref:S1/P1 Nuclease n=2 Tax=Pseudochryseolinea flava TaxID=2059302 RepID=A0A364Y1R3_9BACT|nr:S1/P1 Nuclease [Pseudochryseolinea flava]